ncbi:MAG TPA: enoyl-CoA hydratase-related protein [Vineibacter sp.]|nr:enoyl-CoA hydratase-related protein [Vineibacter sp.]
MTEQPVLVDVADGVMTVTLNRPARLNAMSHALIAAVSDALDRARDDAKVRCVLLTGTGRGFCAGADLADGGPGDAGADGKPDVGSAMERLFNPMIRRVRALPKPVIAAVNGVAAGGGANLALAADIVVAARSARFDQAFVRISLMPDLGGTWFLPHNVGDARARALAMQGTSVPAEQAERMGMIWQVVDDAALMDEAKALAKRMAAGPPLAYAVIKRALNEAGTSTLDQALDLERDSQRMLSRSEDSREGIAAFLAKRPAQFKGR